MAGVRVISLNELDFKFTNAVIIGVIIAKQRVKIFQNKMLKEDRGVWTITIRDSPSDIINVTCWGSQQYVQTLDSTFQVGDVVNIIKPKIEIRQLGAKSENFVPYVTSSFLLTLNENHSDIVIHDGSNYENYAKLLSIPTKPVSGITSLSDLHKCHKMLSGKYIDVLVAVRSIGLRKNITTKDNRQLELRDIVLMDHTYAGISLQLWESELIDRSEHWHPRDTILFIANVYVKPGENINLAIHGRSLITVDPAIPEADYIRKCIDATPVNDLSVTHVEDELFNINVNSIRNVLSCAGFEEKLDSGLYKDTEGILFTARLYSYITEMDLIEKDAISTRCGQCNGLIDAALGVCFKANCPVASGSVNCSPKTGFDITVSISDHTGSLNYIKMTGKLAERILEFSMEDFLKLSDTDKTTLNWKLLLERCDLTLAAVQNKAHSQLPIIYLLSCVIADPLEASRKLPLY